MTKHSRSLMKELSKLMIDARAGTVKDSLLVAMHRIIDGRLKETEKRLTKRRRRLEMRKN